MAQAVSRRARTRASTVRGRRLTAWAVWGLWWTKWFWDRFFSELFGFPLPVSFHLCSIVLCHQRMNNRPVAGRSSETVLPHRHEQQQQQQQY
jgi:hypothetical protein